MNKLTINTSKTKVMLFGSRHRIKNVNKPEIYLNDVQLQVVPTYRYLGVNLDQTLNFKYHLESLINIISFKLYLFSKVRRFLTPSTLDSCSYRFKMYLIAENMPFHMVKNVFKYSFIMRRYGVFKMSTSHEKSAVIVYYHSLTIVILFICSQA